jgi:two-component system, OmpR family, copper resistance phosphate regulon response regulator CusR
LAGEHLRNGLVEHGFVADISHRGDDGLDAATGGEYDLIILDVMLPERDGWSVLSALRAAGRSTPVLFLTARDGVKDRVKGLELGADDLVKPFAFSELLARVRSVFRRGPGRQSDVLRVADLEIDITRHHASRDGPKSASSRLALHRDMLAIEYGSSTRGLLS